MDKAFELDPSLARDTHRVCELSLSSVLLMNDARFPWLILIPRAPGMRDVIDLPHAQRAQLWEEVAQASQTLREIFSPHKLNVAALGNVVEQLHVHVIARFRDDPAWPRPVWNLGTAEPYIPADMESLLKRLHASLCTVPSVV